MYIYVIELYLSLFEVFKSVSESFNVCVFLSWEGCSGRYEDKHKLNSTAKSQSLKVPGFEYEVWSMMGMKTNIHHHHRYRSQSSKSQSPRKRGFHFFTHQSWLTIHLYKRCDKSHLKQNRLKVQEIKQNLKFQRLFAKKTFLFQQWQNIRFIFINTSKTRTNNENRIMAQYMDKFKLILIWLLCCCL